MKIDVYLVLYIGISFLVLMIFLILNHKKNVKNAKRVKDLTKEIEKLKKNVFDKDISLTTYENVKQTSLIVSEIKKRENLEDEIARLKKVLQDTKMIAQDASMIKKDFLTNIRHEIRTPMNSILVFSEMLSKELQNKQFNTYANNIFSSGHSLFKLLNNVLELSEIEAGSFDVKTSAIDIKNFMNQALEKHREKANRKSLGLSLHISDEVPESVMLDQAKVEEILFNLISNAIKFTKYGDIKISVVQDAFDEVNNEVSLGICVEDTGAGIIQENQEKIFKIFESRDADNSIEYQGTGLGLSINRKLARLMNGDIEVKSEYGTGSKFTLVLRSVEVILGSLIKEIHEGDIDFKLIKPSSILVLDDKQVTLDTVVQSFEGSECKVTPFSNARNTIDYLRDNSIDLLLINVDILTMDDGAVSKVLSKLIDAPVVTLVSGRLRDIDFHKSGVQPSEHIKMPLQKIDLFRVLLKILNSQKVQLQESGHLQIKEHVRTLSFERNKHASLEYFKSQPKEIDELLYEALKTNDLNTIENFALLVKKNAINYKHYALEDFAKKLLENIESFDIEEVDKMLHEYKSKSREFRRA